MDDINYFSKKLTGGAISQRGFQYQLLVSIKYLMDCMNDALFEALVVEQEDDFALYFKKSSCFSKGLSIQCQVKSVLYGLRDLRSYLDSGSCTHKRILICSAFSNDVRDLLEKRAWYERRTSNSNPWFAGDKERVTKDYKEQLNKKQIDFDCFQAVKLDSIPIDYAETIARSAVTEWVQNSKRCINADALFESLYLEISKLAPVRGTLKKTDVLKLIDKCTETREDVYVYLNLMESTEPASGHLTPRERWIYYTESRTEEGIEICPSMHYWDDILHNKKPMTPISYVWEPFAWEFPNLDIKVLNNTNNTLYLTNIIFEVANSRPDPSPLLYIEKSPFSSNKRHLALYNDGWGTLKNVKIQINSSPDRNANFNHYGASSVLGTIEQHQNIDLTNMLHTLTGIDFEGFDRAINEIRGYSGGDFLWNDSPDFSRNSALFEKYLGTYACGVAFINGVLDFDADTAEAQNKHYSIRFSAAVDLYDYAYEGVPAPPSYQYDIHLRICGDSYTVRKPISQVLKPGEIDRFNLRVHCDQSARHRIKVYLEDITGRKMLLDSNILLNLCVPRSGIKYINKPRDNY